MRKGRQLILEPCKGHVMSVAEHTQEASGAVTFDGSTLDAMQPLSRPGRQAWQGLSDARDQDRRVHQENRRRAETGGSRLWRCHGKLYDLDAFLELHPGGPLWLELTRGTDVTQAFEAYHLDGPKTRSVLECYYVRDVEDDEFAHGDRFTFEDHGFFRTLRRRLLERLKRDARPGATTKQATAASPAMCAASVAIIAQFAAAHCWARSSGSLAVAALAGVFLNGMWGVGHNFMHQSAEKAGWLKYAMDFDGSSAKEWMISHGLSHHLDTNLDTDWEHQFFNVRYKDEDTKKGKATILLGPFLMGLLMPVTSVAQAASAGKEAMGGVSDGRGWVDVLACLLPLLQFLSYVRGQGSVKKALLLNMAQGFGHFALQMPLGLGVHHAAPAPVSAEAKQLRAEGRNTFAWKEGQKGGAVDFGEHQVVATSDHSLGLLQLPAFLRDYLCLTLFGYLNNHKLHHMFPGVDHGRLASAYDVYAETAKEFGLSSSDVEPVRTATLWMGMVRYMLKREVRKPRSRL